MSDFTNNQKEIVYLKVDKIYPNPYQPRKTFKESSISELCESIKKYGIIYPVTVRYIKGIYEIIAGDRRLKACKKIGLKEIPAIILNLSDKESASLSLIENMQRESLNFIEEAEGFQTLMVDFGYTQDEIAKILCKKQSSISNKMRILRLNKEIKNTIIENNLSEKHSKSLLKINNPSIQKEILEKIIKFDLNAKKTEKLVENMIEKVPETYPENEQKIKGYIGDIRIFTNTIKNAVDTMQESGLSTNYSVVKKDNSYEINIKVCM